MSKKKANAPNTSPSKLLENRKPAEQKSNLTQINYLYSHANEVYWGKNNLEPQEVFKEIAKNDSVLPLLEIKKDMILKGELVYGYEIMENEQTKFVRVQIPEIENLFENSNIWEEYLPSATLNFLTYGMVPTEFLLNIDRTQIVSFSALETPYIRYKADIQGQVSQKTSAIFYDANREFRGGMPNLETRLEIPVLDTTGNSVANLQAQIYHKFVYLVQENCLNFPYPQPTWQVLRKSGLLEMQNEMVRSKTSYIKNSRKFNYLIYFDELYFPIKYGSANWNNMTAEEREEKTENERKTIQDALKDVNSDGKSITSMTINRKLGSLVDYLPREIELLKIVPIENPTFDNADVVSLQHFQNQTNIAMRVPSSMLGTPTKDNMGGNSGSNVRESYDQMADMLKSTMRKLLSPIDFALAFYKERAGFADKKLFAKFVAPSIPKLQEVTPNLRSPEQNLAKM